MVVVGACVDDEPQRHGGGDNGGGGSCVGPGCGGGGGRAIAIGKLDETFAAGGVYVFANPSSSRDGADIGRSLFVAPDQSIVVAGEVELGSRWADPSVWRLTSSGEPDDFGADGIFQLVTPATDDWVTSVTGDEDGRILFAGILKDRSSVARPMIVRLTPDGTLDTTFGPNGTGIFEASGDAGWVTSVFADSEGLIYGCGQRDGWPFALRLTSSGHLDSTFASGGYLDIEGWGELETRGRTLGCAPSGDGGLYAFTEARTFDGDTHTFILAYERDGRLASAFGSEGRVELLGIDRVGRGAHVGRVVAHPSGGVVAIGNVVDSAGATRGAVWRVDRGGDPVEAFGESGQQFFDPIGGEAGSDAFSDVAIDARGNILCSGNTASNGGDAFLLRLKADGSIDTSFNAQGPRPGALVLDGLAGRRGGVDVVTSLALTPSGSVVATGFSRHATRDLGNVTVFRVR